MRRKTATMRFVAAALRRLARIGIHIELFLVVREGLGSTDGPAASAGWTGRFLGPEDLDKLVALEPYFDAGMLRERFESGGLCYGIWDGDRLIAKMWCDLDEFNFPPNRRPLSPDEAYLYGAYADPDYRGQGLAPFMRSACYDALRRRGRTVFYSYTSFFNTPARRFKEKLGARNELLRMHIRLGNGSGRTITLRNLAGSGS